ncbi:MAG: HD-GYP domain-containing protein [Acetatifactor sp.]
MVKRRYISTRLLTNGMVIDQSILDSTGRILVARKTSLDEYIINSLRKMNISGVYIREGEEEPADGQAEASPETLQKIEKIKKADRVKVTLSESVKERVAEGMQFMFNNPKDAGMIDAANSISGELMKAITQNDAIAVDISALKVSDEYTFKHSVDVASIAMIMAKQSHMSEKDVYQIGVAGLLHDLGKSEIPNEILNKPGRLTDEEFAIMKKHPVFGYNILKDKPELTPEILLGVLQHHEKINGKGYPMGVTEEKLTPYARLLAVADIYDALVTERPYKKGFTPRDSVEMIMAMTGELDIKFIKVFMESVILYPVDSVVALSNGENAKVVENIVGYPTRPKVVGLGTGNVYNLFEDTKCASIIIV